jgi:hypothetical protein
MAGQVMGPVRRTINLICALALTCVSGAAFVYLILFAHGFKWGWVVAAGCSRSSVFIGSTCRVASEKRIESRHTRNTHKCVAALYKSGCSIGIASI